MPQRSLWWFETAEADNESLMLNKKSGGYDMKTRYLIILAFLVGLWPALLHAGGYAHGHRGGHRSKIFFSFGSGHGGHYGALFNYYYWPGHRYQGFKSYRPYGYKRYYGYPYSHHYKSYKYYKHRSYYGHRHHWKKHHFKHRSHGHFYKHRGRHR